MHPIVNRRRTALYAVVLTAVLAIAGALPGVTGIAKAGAHDGRLVDVTQGPYNASGDGTTNDRAAIQQAIDAVSTDGGGIVQLPAGRTFLSGNLTLENNVTLEIDGTLRQSQNPSDYTYTPLLGRTVAGGCTELCGNQQDYFNTWFKNYPLIYAGNKHDVGVTGTGTMFMSQSPAGQSHTIDVIAIGLFRVDNFTITGVEILNNNCYNVVAWQSTNGVISNLAIDAVTQGNTDGINVKNSQHIRITGNEIDNTDDGIIVGSGYGDPRDGTWWQSNPTRGGSQDIEIDHNVDRLHAVNGKAIAFIPWGTTAPDARWTELKNINIHDNFLQAPESIGCWCDNLYNDVVSNSDHSAISQVRIANNKYLYYDGMSSAHFETIEDARITDMVDDFGKLSAPTFLNGGFETTGAAYWSTTGEAGAAATGNQSTGPASATARQEAAGFADGSWYGYLDRSSKDVALYQGLGLSDGIDYQFTAKVLTGGGPIRMFVQNTCTGQTVAQQTLTNTSFETAHLNFTAAGTCGDYHIGFETASHSADTWALVDDADLTIRDTVLDDSDPAFAYSGSWSTVNRPGPIDDTYHWGLAQGSTATISFTGERAILLGLRHWNNGKADVYLDGVLKGRVDTYNVALVDHQVLFDTGPVADGPHSLTVLATGTQNAASKGLRIQLDALIVHP
jgi:hypothetical protein